MHTHKEDFNPSSSTTTSVPTRRLRQSDSLDLSLIHRIAQQDRDAFELLYKRYVPRLTAFLFPLLHDAALVDEAMNDTMFVVWQKAGQFRPATRLSTWVFGIARHKAMQLLRVSTRQAPDLLEPDGHMRFQTGPESLYLQHQQAQMLSDALGTLPPHLRDVVEGVYYAERTYPELANHLGCSVSTLKSRMETARRYLSSRLRQQRRAPFKASQCNAASDAGGIRPSRAARSKAQMVSAA